MLWLERSASGSLVSRRLGTGARGRWNGLLSARATLTSRTKIASRAMYRTVQCGTHNRNIPDCIVRFACRLLYRSDAMSCNGVWSGPGGCALCAVAVI